MKTITPENSKPHLQCPRWREFSRRLFRSFARCWLVPFAIVALASTSRANFILGVTECSCTNLTIQLTNFPTGQLVAELGGVVLDGTYDYASQVIVLVRPEGMAGGSYSLKISQDGTLLAQEEITICACACGCPGPVGPAGPIGLTGATGPEGPPSLHGRQGPAGPRGVKGDKGEKGAKGDIGREGPVGPRGPKGDSGGVAGPTGPAGSAGPVGPAGPAGTNGLNGTNATAGAGSSEYGYIYNLSAQVVPLETAVIFSDNGIHTAGITHGPGSSDIIVLTAGDYKATFSVSGTEPNQFALFLNGVVVADSVYGSGAGTQQNSGQAILTIGANGALSLRNHTSAAAVTLAAAPPIGGTVTAVNASILLQKLN